MAPALPRSQASMNSANTGAAKARDKPPEIFFRKNGMSQAIAAQA